MNASYVGPILVGVSFTCLGVVMRKQHKKNWKAFLIGGVAVLVFAILSIALLG